MGKWLNLKEKQQLLTTRMFKNTVKVRTLVTKGKYICGVIYYEHARVRNSLLQVVKFEPELGSSTFKDHKENNINAMVWSSFKKKITTTAWKCVTVETEEPGKEIGKGKQERSCPQG